MNPSLHFDHIVIGAGSMGAAACRELARRGRTVLGIDRFSVPHNRGSHGGETRIIRKAYFEHPDYIPLLQSAYRGWAGLEEETSEQIYFQTGLFYAGPSNSEILEGVKSAASKYEIPLEKLDWNDSSTSLIIIPSHYELLFEPEAGFLLTNVALEGLIRTALMHGARFMMDTVVTGWHNHKGLFYVTTNAGEFTCDKLIITAGAWSARLLPKMASKLTVTRQVLAWYGVKNQNRFTLGDFPCWLIAEQDLPGAYYGFPVIDSIPGNGLIKVAYHHRGGLADPDSLAEPVKAWELEALNDFVSRTFEGVFSEPERTAVCYYVNSPDDDFIIDQDGGLTYACGFSGHGFKFVPVIGEILADLSITGSTNHPIGFLRADRLK
ncbi:MAG: N-methyl-L-tryptophan oxidase [Bacteroidota bacterium]